MPEITLHLADHPAPLWTLDEAQLAHHPIGDPYWAFAWAGGLGLARFLFDHPKWVKDQHVLDFAHGSGIGAIAAARAGASQVSAAEVDTWARAALTINARLNATPIRQEYKNTIGTLSPWTVIICGDVFYDRELAESLAPWFCACTAAGISVLIGDPGRQYLPRQALRELAEYSLLTQGHFEDTEYKSTRIWLWETHDW